MINYSREMFPAPEGNDRGARNRGQSFESFKYLKVNRRATELSRCAPAIIDIELIVLLGRSHFFSSPRSRGESERINLIISRVCLSDAYRAVSPKTIDVQLY
jgi:hypothetical protein